jgi:hypothetical protein
MLIQEKKIKEKYESKMQMNADNSANKEDV